MSETPRERHKMVLNRICYVCGKTIPETRGVYHAFARIMYCLDGVICQGVVRSSEKDFSQSKRGKHLSAAQIRDAIRSKRIQSDQETR